MRIVFLLFVFFGFLANSQAQYTLSGTVSSTDRSKLISALVYLDDTDIATTTEDDGSFFIEAIPGGVYLLKVSYLGYEDYVVELILGEDTNLDVQLQGTFYNLDQVEISGSRTSSTQPFSYENIDSDYLRERNTGRDMPLLLDGLTNVVTTSDAGAGIGYTSMRVRGSDQSRINVTINGVPLNDAESQSVFWVDLPDFANSVKDIQVQRGVGTSTNGPSAFGATVGLNTHVLNGDNYIDVDAGVGSFNSRKLGVKLGTGILNDKFSVDGRYSVIKSDGYIDRSQSDLRSWMLSPAIYWDDAVLRFDIFSGHEITGQAWWGAPEALVNGDADGLLNHYGNNVGSIYNTPQDSINLFESDRRYNYYTYPNQVDDYQQDHLQAHYFKTFSEKFTTRITGYVTHGQGYFEEYRLDESLPDYGVPGVVINNDTLYRADIIRRRTLDNTLLGAFSNSNWDASANLTLEFGAGYSYYKGKHEGQLIDIVSIITPSVGVPYYLNFGRKSDYNGYSKFNYALSSKLNALLDLQIRGVNYSVEGDDNVLKGISTENDYLFFNPKLGLSYSTDSLRAYASLAIANREPDRNDILNALNVIEVNPEQLLDLEVGFEPTFGAVSLGANAYYMLYKDQLVLTGELNDVGANLRRNVDKSYRRGIELSANARVHKLLSIDANLALSQNKIETFNEVIYNYLSDGSVETQTNVYNNTTIAFSPAVVSNVELSSQVTNNFKVRLGGKYIGKQYLDNTTNDNRSLDAYFVSNAGLSYSLKRGAFKNISVSLNVYNLTNTLYSANGYTYSYAYDGFGVTENFLYPQATTYGMFTMNVRI